MKEGERSLPTALFLFLPLLLYGAAVNPYFPPGTYDDIVFYYGARSLAESGGFQFAGKYVVDWAPGLSVLLAVPMWLGFESVCAAKLCILLCVGAGLFLTFRYLREEGRPRPLVACALFALLPTGFMMGTKIMTEWPFIALSFLFLGLLRSLDGERRGLPLAALAGLVLGVASLTRWVGVLLGVAVLAQAVSRMRAGGSPGFRPILPESIVAAVGAALFCLWKLKLVWQVGSGAAEPSAYYRGYWYLELFAGSDFTALPLRIGDLFFQVSSLGRYLGTDGPAMRGAVWGVCGPLTLWGAVRQFRRRGVRPGDWYALATLTLFALLKQNPQVRYLLPIAPFLLSYFLAGLDAALGAPEPPRWRARLTGAALAAWVVALVILTCPASSDVDRGAYLRRVVDVARWSEHCGCKGVLIYTDNRLIDPWLVAQVILQNTDALCPLVAVQPVYAHPYSVAKAVTSLAYLYGRRVYLNMVAGGFRNDLLALDDATPHDRRYDRLVEYTGIIQSLLDGAAPVCFEGEFYRVRNLRLTPPLPERLRPGVFVSGSSEAGLAAARSLGVTAIQYPKPPEEYGPGEETADSGIRVGVIARELEEEAWAEAHRRFPPDRRGEIAHQAAMKASDSAWHRQLSDMAGKPPSEANPYWLFPFQNYKTFCPYLVGSYDRVAEELARYIGAGFRSFILDIPPTEEELGHIGAVFARASRLAPVSG